MKRKQRKRGYFWLLVSSPHVELLDFPWSLASFYCSRKCPNRLTWHSCHLQPSGYVKNILYVGHYRDWSVHIVMISHQTTQTWLHTLTSHSGPKDENSRHFTFCFLQFCYSFIYPFQSSFLSSCLLHFSHLYYQDPLIYCGRIRNFTKSTVRTYVRLLCKSRKYLNESS